MRAEIDNDSSGEEIFFPVTEARRRGYWPSNPFRHPLSERSRYDALCAGLVDFINSEEGPTAVEYAVMLALIIVVCLAAISVLGSSASGKFKTVADTISGS